MAGSSQSAIVWPLRYTPGETDNYVSNEVIAKGITASQIWSLLADVSKWETYYHNCEKITPPKSGTTLEKDSIFRFSTFGFPVLDCVVEESVPSGQGRAGRIAWSAKLDGDADTAVDVYHAWLVEDLPGGRVRILTQESQNGKPAAQLNGAKPNKMLMGHQDWLEGLIRAARGEERPPVSQTNLGSIS